MREQSFHTQIGIQLRELRKKKGLTQIEAARKLNISSRALQYIEAGTNNTTAELLLLYSKLLDTKLSTLLLAIGY